MKGRGRVKRKRYHIIVMVVLTILFGRIRMTTEVCALDRVKSGEDKGISVSVESEEEEKSSETVEPGEDGEDSGKVESEEEEESSEILESSEEEESSEIVESSGDEESSETLESSGDGETLEPGEDGENTGIYEEGGHDESDETPEGETGKSQEEEIKDDIHLNEATPSEAEYTETATPSSAEIMLLNPLLENGGCRTAEDLKQQVESGEYEKILVTGDIIVEDEFRIETEKNVVIDMNGNRLIVQSDGGLSIAGPVQVVGQVTEEALAEVNGSLTLKDKAEIYAEGEGAVAVWCKYHVSLQNAAIRSSGRSSRALVWESDRLCDLDNSTVEAQGSGSIGILSDAGIKLRFSRVLSQGGEAIVSTGEIFLDATLADPLPDEAVVIKREIYPAGREEENGISIAAGSGREEFLRKLPNSVYLLFYDESGTAEDRTTLFSVTWSNLPDDFSREGEYMAVCHPILPHNSNRLPLPDLKVPVHVVNPSKPHIQEIFRMGYSVAFRYLNPVIGAEKLQLMYSTDEGRNWHDAASMPGGSLALSEYTAGLNGMEINKKYLFKLVAIGGPMEGESLAVPFYYYENDSDRYEHGGRDGDDRDEEDETLPDSIPPIFSDNGGSDSDGGGEYSSFAKPFESNQNLSTAVPSEAGQNENSSEPSETGPNNAAAEPTDPDQTSSTAGTKEQNPVRQAFAANEPDQNINSDMPVLDQYASGRQHPLAIVLSGRQLSDQLQANSQWITFAGEGVKVDLPVDGLRNLSLEEDDTFTALLQRTVSDRFAIRFWSGETELTEFGTDGFFVELPWKEAAGNEEVTPVVCEREDGLEAAAHLSDGKIRGRLYKTGEYQIRIEREEQSSQKTGTSSPVKAAGMVLAGTAMVFFLIRYRKKARGGRI